MIDKYNELYAMGLFTHAQVARMCNMTGDNFCNWRKKEFRVSKNSTMGNKRIKLITKFLEEIENER